MFPDDLGAYDDEGWRLTRELEDTADRWYSVYREYWGLDRDSPPDHLSYERWEDAKRFAAAAPNILKLALALNAKTVLTGDRSKAMDARTLKAFREALTSYAESPLIRDFIGFELASDALLRLRSADENAIRLLRIVLDHQLGGRAEEYLARATRLYVLGFEPECLVMCRAALDAALQERVTDEMLDSAGTKRHDLWSRIKVASALGIFTGTQREDADRLRLAGNEAVHTVPAFLTEGISDAATALTTLSGLLAALFLD